MMLVSKITLAVLMLGLVAFLAVTLKTTSTAPQRYLGEVVPPENLLLENPEGEDMMTMEKPSVGLRGGEAAVEGDKERFLPESAEEESNVVPEEEKAESNVVPEEEKAATKGSRRFLWYYTPSAPKPKPMYQYPKYSPPKYYNPPEPKYYNPAPPPRYAPPPPRYYNYQPPPRYAPPPPQYWYYPPPAPRYYPAPAPGWWP